MTRLTRWAFASDGEPITSDYPRQKTMLLPIIWAAAFLFFVLDMHYPAAAFTPGPFCRFSREYPADERRAASSADALRFCRIPGKKKTRTAPVAESSQKIILFDYRVSIPRAARMRKRSFAILFGGFLAS